MPKTIAVVAKKDDPLALRNAQALEAQASSPEFSKSFDLTLGLPTADNPCDLVICIGGDGTLLATIRKVGALRHKCMFLGVHGSRGLGFLHSVRQPEEGEDPSPWAKNILSMLQTRQYVGESRWGLEAQIVSSTDSKPLGKLWALNDIVLGKGSLSRMIEVKVSVGEQVMIPKLRGDGLILSSPTGSTAYSLSAGGPMMDPAIRALLLTPVCSHTMGLRPMVLNGDRQIQVERLDENTSAMITADGQEGMDLEKGVLVKIKMSHEPVRLLLPNSEKCQSPNYFEVLRDKLGFGRDRHAR